MIDRGTFRILSMAIQNAYDRIKRDILSIVYKDFAEKNGLPNLPCKFGLNCLKLTCKFQHPFGWNPK